MITSRVTVPVEPEYTATDYLRLIAEGWEVIESTGSQMTIQNPEDDGPQDLVIDVDAMLSAAPDALQVMDREALIALIMEETTDDIIADGWDRLGKPNVLAQGCRYIRRNAPPGPEGYANPEAAAKQFAGFIADRLLAAQGAK